MRSEVGEEERRWGFMAENANLGFIYITFSKEISRVVCPFIVGKSCIHLKDFLLDNGHERLEVLLTYS